MHKRTLGAPTIMVCIFGRDAIPALFGTSKPPKKLAHWFDQVVTPFYYLEINIFHIIWLHTPSSHPLIAYGNIARIRQIFF